MGPLFLSLVLPEFAVSFKPCSIYAEIMAACFVKSQDEPVIIETR